MVGTSPTMTAAPRVAKGPRVHGFRAQAFGLPRNDGKPYREANHSFIPSAAATPVAKLACRR